MSCLDGFIYNFLTMGVIFPWVYVYGPAFFPHANLEFAIILTLLAQLPISLSYCILATVLPVSGGDYIYQTRAFGNFGFISVMSGFVLWILGWIPISGWLFVKLGLTAGERAEFSSTGSIAIVSIGNVSGYRSYLAAKVIPEQALLDEFLRYGCHEFCSKLNR